MGIDTGLLVSLLPGTPYKGGPQSLPSPNFAESYWAPTITRNHARRSLCPCDAI